jgi:hypothetical protein
MGSFFTGGKKEGTGFGIVKRKRKDELTMAESAGTNDGGGEAWRVLTTAELYKAANDLDLPRKITWWRQS